MSIPLTRENQFRKVGLRHVPYVQTGNETQHFQEYMKVDVGFRSRSIQPTWLPNAKIKQAVRELLLVTDAIRYIDQSY